MAAQSPFLLNWACLRITKSQILSVLGSTRVSPPQLRGRSPWSDEAWPPARAQVPGGHGLTFPRAAAPSRRVTSRSPLSRGLGVAPGAGPRAGSAGGAALFTCAGRGCGLQGWADAAQGFARNMQRCWDPPLSVARLRECNPQPLLPAWLLQQGQSVATNPWLPGRLPSPHLPALRLWAGCSLVAPSLPLPRPGLGDGKFQKRSLETIMQKYKPKVRHGRALEGTPVSQPACRSGFLGFK